MNTLKHGRQQVEADRHRNKTKAEYQALHDEAWQQVCACCFRSTARRPACTYLSRNFPAPPSPFQVVAGTMTQAAYIEAFKDLAGSRQNVSKKAQQVHQVGHNG